MQNADPPVRFLHAAFFMDSKINLHHSLSSNEKTVYERPTNFLYESLRSFYSYIFIHF